MNDYWSKRVGENTPWMKSEELRILFKRTQWVLVLCAVAGFTGAALFIFLAQQSARTVLVTADGRSYAGTPGTFYQPREAIERLTKDVLKAVFFRTERGSIDGMVNAATSIKFAAAQAANPSAKLTLPRPSAILETFVHPDVLAELDNQFGSSDGERGAYTQFYLPLELRIVGADPELVEIHARGILTSSNIREYKSNEVFVSVMLRPVKRTDANPLGWKVYGLVKMDHDTFYDKEIKEKIRQATKTETPKK
jgi:hypothetical protein